MTQILELEPEVLRVEQRGIEPVPAQDRRGKPNTLTTLWLGANIEFATLVTGVLATSVFGLSFWQAFLGILIGNLLGALLLGALSVSGPAYGVPQLVQSRGAFGFLGNLFPSALNFIAGCSWFAVNTVLGVFALEQLLSVSFGLGLAMMVVFQILIAVVGHHLIHTVERVLFAFLLVVFVIVSFYGFGHGHTATHFSAKTAGPLGFSGAFILTVSISFSYVLGWIPYASDYTRYLPANTSKNRIFHSVFWSMLISGVWLEALGAAFGNTKIGLSTPTQLVGGLLPHALGEVTLVAVVLGTITANVLNIYSGALSSLVLGIPLKRWMAALVVGAIGTIVSWIAGQHNYWTHYENFLFFLGYWVAPWTAIVAIDLLIVRRRQALTSDALFDRRFHWGRGFAAWVISIICSLPFMNQTIYHGYIANRHPGLGDVTYYVSFVVAAVVYFAITAGDKASSPAAIRAQGATRP
jgi:NCS1 family nucleobase:cation symporter-1